MHATEVMYHSYIRSLLRAPGVTVCICALTAGCNLVIDSSDYTARDASALPDSTEATPDGAIAPIDAAEAATDGADMDSRQPADGGPDAIPCDIWNPHFFDPCDSSIALGSATSLLMLNLSGQPYVFNTDDESLRAPDGTLIDDIEVTRYPQDAPSMVILAVDRLEIQQGATLRAIGLLPLVVAARSEIIVHGTIDIASHGNDGGAGHDPELACGQDGGNGTGKDGQTSGGQGGGGGGGGFGDHGGAGANYGSGSGGLRGVGVSVLYGGLGGGCRGGNGGNGGGEGGLGGGALQLAALQQISIHGIVHAGGAGGAGIGILASRGGGGGGSGGLILLDAPDVYLALGSGLFANGGGGGGSSSTLGAGSAGTDGLPSAMDAASGGSGAGDGGSGGWAGSPLGSAGGTSGGGGGGGVGYILIHATTRTPNEQAVSSPAIRDVSNGS